MSCPASILERSSTSLIRPSRCLPLLSMRLQHAAHLFRRVAVDIVEDQLGVAENGVERGAQLVAHVGEELRLVLARLGSWRLLCWISSNRRTFSIAITAWSANVADQLDLLFGEWPHLRFRVTDEYRRLDPSRSIGTPSIVR